MKWFQVQFGVNKHKWIFQRQGKVPFVVIKKLAGAYLHQITQEKLYYLVTIDMKLISQNVEADNILIVCTVCSALSHCASRLFYTPF